MATLYKSLQDELWLNVRIQIEQQIEQHLSTM